MKVLLFSLIFIISVGLIIPGYAYFEGSPYQQFTSGKFVEEVFCKIGFEKILKNNGFPACVKSDHVEKIFERDVAQGFLQTIQIRDMALSPNISSFKEGEAIIKFKKGFRPLDTYGELNEKLMKTNMPEFLVLNEKFDVFSFENIIPKPTNPKFGEKSIGFEDLFLIKFDKRIDVNKAISEFSILPYVDYALPNYLGELTLIPNDPEFFVDQTQYYGNWRGQWAMHNIGETFGSTLAVYDADIDGPESWDINTGSSDIIIAVIDTGVDVNHPDFGENIWTNIDEVPNNGIDDDGNGYIDDFYGYDFANNDRDPTENPLHGTNSAGIIGAVGNNGMNIAGVAWNVKIMALKAGDESSGTFALVDTIEALYYALMMEVNITNNSYSYHFFANDGEPQPLVDVVYALDDAGIFVIASAGNFAWDIDNSQVTAWPAKIDSSNVISVAAIDMTDNLSDWGQGRSSNWGPISVDLAAPGTKVRTLESTDHNGIYIFSGTSASAPFVSGAAAVLMSEYPDENYLQIKDRILDKTVKLGTLKDKMLTGGRLNLYTSLIAPTPSIVIVEFKNDSYHFPGTAIVRVVDTDLNLNPNAIDNLDIDIWSDSDAGGIDLTVTETAENTGIFEGTIFLTVTDESSGHRLRVAHNDVITAEHKGHFDTSQIFELD